MPRLLLIDIIMAHCNPQLIKESLSNLRSVKTSVFLNKNVKADFKSVVETCRIIDVVMLPLFYIWAHCYHRELSEVCMEQHLKKPYERFLRDPFSNTFESYLFLRIDESDMMPPNIKRKVLTIYELLLTAKSNIEYCRL